MDFGDSRCLILAHMASCIWNSRKSDHLVVSNTLVSKWPRRNTQVCIRLFGRKLQCKINFTFSDSVTWDLLCLMDSSSKAWALHLSRYRYDYRSFVSCRCVKNLWYELFCPLPRVYGWQNSKHLSFYHSWWFVYETHGQIIFFVYEHFIACFPE